jgi:O-antigen/teichoic acid export membrane protein
MSLLRKLAGETAIYGVASILGRLLNWVVLTPYFTRVFQRGEFGVVQELYTYAAILMVLYTFRLETAFFRYGSEEDGMKKSFATAALTLVVSTVIFSALLLSLAAPLAAYLKFPEHPEYVVWFTLIIAFDALAAIPFARLRLENRPLRFVLLKTLNIVFTIIFIFALLEGVPYLQAKGWNAATGFYRPEDRVSYVFVANVLASLLIFLILSPAYAKIRPRFDWLLWKKMMVYASPLVVAGLAAVVNQLIGIPLLKFLGPGDLASNQEQVGLYGAAAKLAVIMNLFITAFNYAAEPFFFKNARREDARQVYAQVAQAFALAGSLFFLLIMLYLDIAQFFLGRDFREGLGVTPILLVANFSLGLYYVFSVWFKLTDNTHFGGYIALTGAAITIGLNVSLIPRIGYYGPAWAALACYFAMAMLSYWTGRRRFPVPYPLGRIFGYLTAALLAYGLSLAARPALLATGLWAVLLANTFILALYAGVVYWMEREVISRYLRRFRSSGA